ncbi:MAG: hypothetical protein PVJ07_02610 [Anaerolineales bacterium]|jgi:F0F1-type ATP synthase membrane subunit c/vacuolar-type H+-ATPase subunit K
MEDKKRRVSYFGLLFPVGIGLGVAIGALLHNIGVGMAFGAAIGVTASLLTDWLSERRMA